MAMSEKMDLSRDWYQPNGPADSMSSQLLRSRWAESTGLTAAICKALKEQGELPADTPTVSVKIGSKDVELVDLRGFAFRGATLGQVDLSYCCLDFSDFQGCSFAGTSLQFSTFRYSLLNSSRWDGVQAAPVSLRGALMRRASVSRCFFMHSDLNAIDLSESTVSQTSLASSDLRNASLDRASFVDVDLRSTLVTDNPSMRKWYSMQRQGTRDHPEWFQSDSPVRSSNDDAVVMVVEDSATMREVLTQQLRLEGYQVVLAHDGAEAIQELRNVTPDLLLVDIQMPNMDGLELMRCLRNEVTTSALPVVMLTALTDVSYRKQAMEAGVTDYFTKSNSNDDLLARIREILAVQRTHAHW